MYCIICKQFQFVFHTEAIIGDKCLCSIECVREYFNRKEDEDEVRYLSALSETPQGDT